ncbi:hypothetical protein Tco_0900193 [Tanacetum coccineum]
MEWCTNTPKDGMPSADSYSTADMTTLNTRRTPIQKQPEALLCLVGLSRNYFLGDDCPECYQGETGTRPRTAHEVPLLTATVSHVTDMEDTIATSESSGTPSTIEKSPLDFANENPPPLIIEKDGTKEQVVLGPDLEKEVATMGPLVNKRRRKRGNDEADANAPPKVLRKDHAASRPIQSTLRGKSLASMGLEAGSTVGIKRLLGVTTA